MRREYEDMPEGVTGAGITVRRGTILATDHDTHPLALPHLRRPARSLLTTRTMNYVPLAPADDATLHWRQPGSWNQRYVLQTEDRLLGSLEYTSSLKNSAIAETAAGRWSFEPEGFWKPRIVVQRDGVALASLEVTNVWLQNRAVLAAMDGAPIAVWEMTSMLRGFVEWRAADGGPLIQYRMGTDEGGVSNWIRTQCRVDFAPDGFAHAERDLLVCLGWHMTVLAMNPAV